MFILFSRQVGTSASSVRSGTSDVGSEYRSKKAKGDVKKKGKVDPYAYLPLKRTTLNKRLVLYPYVINYYYYFTLLCLYYMVKDTFLLFVSLSCMFPALSILESLLFNILVDCVF